MTWDQDYLREKSILVIGCGGLTHAALPYLLSSGIGNVTLFDGDVVETSNLNRQHLFSPNDIGRNKALVLKEYCAYHFPKANVISEERMFDDSNKEHLFDLAFDFTDRLATKLELAMHFEKQHIPFFYAAAQMNAGSSAFVHLNSITAEELFGHISDSSKVERDCATDGVWPTVVAEVGIHVAHQALQFLTLSPCAFIEAIDYFDGISGMWSRFHFEPKFQTKKIETTVKELLRNCDTSIFYLGEKEDLPSDIIIITPFELRKAIEESNGPCILLCESGLRAKAASEQLSKKVNYPVIGWNENLESFLHLLNEVRI
ncbi:MAG: hypothetical protein RL664_495 [Bacteroidota bacterium]